MFHIRSSLLLVLVALGLGVPLAAPAMAAEEPVGPTPDNPVASVTTGRGPFVDDDGHVFEHDIAALASAGLTDGCAPGLFCPDEPVTRGQMAAFLRRAFPDLPVVGERQVFSDMGGSVFVDDVAWLAATGVTQGCGPDRFCPDESVTRGQMAAFLHRAMSAAGRVDEGVEVGDLGYADAEFHLFENDIAWLVSAGISSGCGATGAFCPDADVTRGQMAAFLVRALDIEPVGLTETVSMDLSEPLGPGAEGWRVLIAQFFEPEDVDRAVRVMACESKGDPNAANPRSSARGLFQHLGRLWPERVADAGFPGASIYDPIANTAAAAWLVYEDPLGWNHWAPSSRCW